MKLVVAAVLLAAVAICQAIPYPDKTKQELSNNNPGEMILSADSTANENKNNVFEIGGDFVFNLKLSHSIRFGETIHHNTSDSKIEITNNTHGYEIPAAMPFNRSASTEQLYPEQNLKTVSHEGRLSRVECNATTPSQWPSETTAATPLNRSAITELPYLEQNLTAASSGEGLTEGEYSATTPSQSSDRILWISANVTTAAEYADRALVAGHEGWGGSPLWVIRTLYNGAILPGKLAIQRSTSYIPYHGKEVTVNNFEILLADPDDVNWLPSRNGRYPHNAILGGISDTGKLLYICRVPHKNSTTPGLLYSSRQHCFISYNHEEVSFKDYEVLCES